MNKKGFTLVELLAVIVILAVILAIAIPSITNIVDNSKYNGYKSSLALILKTAKIKGAQDQAPDGQVYNNTSLEGYINNPDSNIKFQVTYYQNGNSNITANYGGTDYQTLGSNGKWQVSNANYDTVNSSVLNSSDNTTIVAINPNNLFENGYGQLKNNTNFTSFTYDGSNAKESQGSFKRTASTQAGLFSDNYIAVDTSKQYIESGWFKNNGTAATYYIGFVCYDIDKNRISSQHVMYITNTKTTLAQDLKDGDTTVYLTDVSRFQVSSSTPTHQLGLIFWNYKDSTGYQYSEETYSRNAWGDLYLYTGVNTSNNTITLKTAWNHGTVPAGTSVNQSNAGNNYNYALMSNSTLTSSWQFKKTTISDVVSPLGDSNNNFRYGTKYVKFLAYDNYNSTANTTTWYSGLQFVEADKY